MLISKRIYFFKGMNIISPDYWIYTPTDAYTASFSVQLFMCTLFGNTALNQHDDVIGTFIRRSVPCKLTPAPASEVIRSGLVIALRLRYKLKENWILRF